MYVNQIKANPKNVTVRGRVLMWGGRKDSCVIGLSIQFRVEPIKMAPIDKRRVGVKIFGSVL